MRSFSHSESAFTTETPTPWRPPETLYEFWSNLPPACSSVMTISAAERLRSSSSLMSVGIPRPLSTTEMELSVWMITLMSSQWPASASSIALSTTSNTMWCRPVPSEVSPMYMAGRLRTASRPLRILMLLESYSAAARPFGWVTSGRVAIEFLVSGRPAGSDAHRHHDVLEVVAARHLHEGARVRVAHRDAYCGAIDVVEDVEEVRDVESDVERIAVVFHGEPLFGLLLLVVRADDGEGVLGEHQPHAADLLVGEDRRAVDRLREHGAVERDPVLVRGGDHLLVVGELALDDLRDDLDAAEAEAHLVGTDRERDRVVGVGEELDELDHGLVRQDRFDRAMVGAERAAREREPVPIRRDDPQHVPVDREEDAVQVVADVLHRHGELHQAQGVLERFLRQGEGLGRVLRLDHAREIGRRQRLQVEAALARPHHHAVLLRLERDVRVLGQRPKDVVELARSDRHSALGVAVDRRLRGDLDLEIGGEELERGARCAHEHVGKDRQGVPAL